MSLSKIIPIKREELAKFLLTSMMMVLTLYIYSILRNTKDVLILDTVGGEMISFLKLYAVLPAAILMMLAYTKLVDILPRIAIYHLLNAFFIGYFVVFDLFIYSNADALHFDFSSLIEAYPRMKYIILIIANWSFSLFYIFSELWGTMMLSLMFWQLVNQINSMDEAKRFYPLFGFLGQTGLISAGILGKFFSKELDWSVTLHHVCSTVLISGILLSISLHCLGKFIVGEDVINGASNKKKKEKLGLMASLKYIASSRYIRLIALLIICYGISINLVEGVWKGQVKALYSSKSEITNFMGSVQTATGIVSFIAMLTGSYALRTFSWRINANATPIIILLTGVPFFIFVVYRNDLGIDPTDVLLFAVMLGAVQNVLSKAVKYAFFDPTKEMSYIPLDDELKAKGKAAADVIGGRFGKSGGAFITSLLLTLITGADLVSLAPHLGIVFTVIMIVWIYAVSALSIEFNKMNKPSSK